MKIEVKKEIKDAKKYYDEYLYCYICSKTIIKNTNKRTDGGIIKKYAFLTVFLSMYIVISSYCLINAFNEHDTTNFILNLILLIIISIYDMGCIRMFRQLNKTMEILMQDKVKENYRIITFDKKELISSYADELIIRIKYDTIKYIIINRYSISFYIVEKNSRNVLAVPIEYKEEILKAIKKYKLEEKLIDNSYLYK